MGHTMHFAHAFAHSYTVANFYINAAIAYVYYYIASNFA